VSIASYAQQQSESHRDQFSGVHQLTLVLMIAQHYATVTNPALPYFPIFSEAVLLCVAHDL